MRDAIILATFEGPAGIVFEHVQRAEHLVSEFGLSDTFWCARHPDGVAVHISTGATPGEALARLLNDYPELAERKAA